MTIGDRIKERRIELGMTQDDLAAKCGYKSRSSINKIELSRELPLSKAQKMADVLGVTPGFLMGWEEEQIDTDTIAMLMHRCPHLIEMIGKMNIKNLDQLEEYAEFILKKEGKL